MTFSSDDVGAPHPSSGDPARVVDIDAWRARRLRDQRLTDLTHRFYPRVRGFLAGLGVGDPDDGANEVLARVVTRLDAISGGEAGLTAFVFTVARNFARDEARRAHRRVRSDAVAAPPERSAPDDTDVDVIANRSVVELLGDLSREQREVLLCRVVADLSLEDTALIVGKPVSAVKALQRRAVNALRRRLDDGT
jgi:RNA polymerase sigma-70 factor (ECF subfamily)